MTILPCTIYKWCLISIPATTFAFVILNFIKFSPSRLSTLDTPKKKSNANQPAGGRGEGGRGSDEH